MYTRLYLWATSHIKYTAESKLEISFQYEFYIWELDLDFTIRTVAMFLDLSSANQVFSMNTLMHLGWQGP